MYGEIFRKIDDLIFSTDLGKYIELGAIEDNENGQILIDKMATIYFDWRKHLNEQEKALAKEIKKLLGNIDYRKYLMYLESTNVDKLEFMISHDILIDIDDLL
ncbi:MULTISPECIES: hypothetical protein [Ruminococcus]|uniref:Uncharacterized protein n=1 Tax=Ruminococcus bovis TaxID=2564099 RepID=A0A4P8XTM1_9FIRM|nr:MULTISPECIES: hypothetical protein [Ruminococcus]MEE3439337.1 hypothetical protein [Ruminococcus sp.]QCT06321.1 hypothetical protein E5Z56_02660 [Ruminococcus bovis]